MSMKICPKCNNQEFTKEGLCEYCLWKGDIGPGKLLREIIKAARDNKKD